MEMRFQFEQSKAIQVMAYLVGRLTSVEKVKLMKLVYLADKAHFLRCGYPITGDRLCALPYGPVPSLTLDVLNGDIWPEPEAAYEFLHLDDNTVMLRSDPGHALLNADETQRWMQFVPNMGLWQLGRSSTIPMSFLSTERHMLRPPLAVRSPQSFLMR